MVLTMVALWRSNEISCRYSQPDEFLVSGESLVRNLMYGIKTVSELGASTYTRIGHVPDQFGHTSQLPQIFAGFDLLAAVTMRGVDASDGVTRNAWWDAPDGTRMLLLKLTQYCG